MLSLAGAAITCYAQHAAAGLPAGCTPFSLPTGLDVHLAHTPPGCWPQVCQWLRSQRTHQRAQHAAQDAAVTASSRAAVRRGANPR